MFDKATMPASFLSSLLETLQLLCEQQRASNQPACSFHTTGKLAGCFNRLRLKSLRPYQKNLSVTFLDEENAATLNNTLVSLVAKWTNPKLCSSHNSSQVNLNTLYKRVALPLFPVTLLWGSLATLLWNYTHAVTTQEADSSSHFHACKHYWWLAEAGKQAWTAIFYYQWTY